jgi:hypothetical protein
MRAPAALALAAIAAVLALTACADPEPAAPEISEFVASCRDALAGELGDDVAATAACECAETTAEERMSDDAYAMFLISFLPDSDARADEIMAREGFSVDVEAFSLTMLEVMEDCGFGEVQIN